MWDLLVQQRQGLGQQLFRFQIEVAALGAGFLQGIEQRPPYPHGVVEVAAGVDHNGVHLAKSEPGHLAQLIKALMQQRRPVRAKEFIDPGGGFWGDFEGSHHRHDIPDGLALRIARLNLLQPFFSDAPDLQQLFRVVLNNAEGVRAEPLDDLPGGLGADALQQPGGQVAQDALDGERYQLMPRVHLELGAALAVCPIPVQLHLDGVRLGKVVAHGHKADQVVRKFVLVPGGLRHHGICRFQPQNAVFSGLVVKQRLVIRRHNTAHDIASYAAAWAAVNFTLNVWLSDTVTYWP